MRFPEKATGNFVQNHGVPGVVYILENSGLRHGYVKIGCSSRSGAARAYDLNIDANTGTPGSYSCIFEWRTKDCGLAEQRVFALLKDQRRGKWGQEFFEVDTEHAKATIRRVCGIVDSEVSERIAKEQSAATTPEKLSPPIERFRPESPPPYYPAANLRKNRSPFIKWAIVVGILAAFTWWAQKDDKPLQRPTPVRPKPKLSVAPGKSPTVAPSRPQRDSRVDVQRLPDAASEPPAESRTMQPTVEQIPTTKDPESNLHMTMPEQFDHIEPTETDRDIIEKSCGPASSNGPAFKACIERELESLAVAPPYPSFDGVRPADVARIYKACQPTEYSSPGAYRTCLKKQVDALAATTTHASPGRK